MSRDDLSGGDFERCKRCRGAMPLVIVALAGQGAARKVRVGALAPGLASREVNLVAAQKPPDILDVNITQRRGQQRAAPARKPVRRRLIQQLQNPLVGGLRINRLLARPRLVLQPFKALVGIAMPPQSRMNSKLAG